MKKNNTSLYLVVIFAVALLIGVGYAALSATLKINGQTTINKATWDVHFENISTNDKDAIKFYNTVTSNSSTGVYSFADSIADITSVSGTVLNYTVTLKAPDATADTSHNVTFDVVNKGTMDATISEATLPTTVGWDNGTTNSAIAGLTTIGCTYSDGSTIKKGDIIKAGSSKTVICKHHYNSPSELRNDDLKLFNSYTVVSKDFSLVLNFIAK